MMHFQRNSLMQLKRWSRQGLIGLVLILCAPGCIPSNKAADLILTNAQVYTLNWQGPDGEGHPSSGAPVADGTWLTEATAIAIRNGMILGVGSESEMMIYSGTETLIRDMNGAFIVPGLIESHGHLHEIGEKAEQINLVGVESETDIADRLMEGSERPAGEWIIGSGWDEGSWANHLPTRGFLNEMFPDNPVVLKGLRGFGTLGNDLALEAAGVDAETPDPVGGSLVRDNKGQLTGVFLNNATDILNDAIPEASLEQRIRVLNYGIDRMLESGFVSTHHAGVRTDYLPAYQAMGNGDSLRIRVEAMLSVGVVGAPSAEEWTEMGPTVRASDLLQIRSVKAYYDASLGSRGAKMIDDYSDMPGHRGIAGSDYGFDTAKVEAFMAAGFQAGIHAIGDAGNRDVLDFYESVYERHPEARRLRNRIEHAQVIHPDDFERFAELGIVASMEPGHAVEDSPWAEERIGADRVKGAYAWRTLRQHGVPVLFNSDYTGTDWSFFYGMYAAITRKMADGTPDGGWYPEQSLTAEEALRAYTYWPAFASGREHLTGTIKPGKWADLTVMDIDPLNASPDELLGGQVLMTIVAGKVAYEIQN
ncbi:MAG: amidohydrolase [Rhodothermales bacterium]|nr:amidohydrolase [Rhodothermales bacterium]MDG2015635.1 amidohydrolase [Rhodothermales bacterium]